MKGFAVRRPTVNPLTGEYPLLGSNPAEGSTVLLDIRVYNYSISAIPTSPFQVKIYTIPYDADTNNEICTGLPTTGAGGRVCPASARTFIGSASTQVGGGLQTFQLTARHQVDAYYLWNIHNMGPANTGVNEYRVYVVLDSGNDPSVELNPAEPPCTQVPCEDNAGNEGAANTYSTLDPGQNNEGWALLSVGPPSLTLIGGAKKEGRSSVTKTVLSAVTPARTTNISATAVAGDANDHKAGRGNKVIAYLHQPVHLRIAAFSTVEASVWSNAIIYDLGARQGLPTAATVNQSPVIAGKYVLGTRPQGSSAWFDWTPRKKGVHHLYAVVQNANGTKTSGELYVYVRRAPCDLNGDGRVDRHDMNILSRDVGKPVAASACGKECDLDGDGKITAKDLDLMSQACDSADCAFRSTQYVGGASPEEPDMRAVHPTEEASLFAFRQAGGETEGSLAVTSSQQSEAQLFQAERERKQSLRSIKYYYRGNPVMQGQFAEGNTLAAKR